MNAPLYFTKATLRRDAPIAALRRVMIPDSEGARTTASHRLVWTLFGDSPARERDFLWREAEPGVFYVLSSRPPEDRHAMFEVECPKLFAPALQSGDQLEFSLRANATIAKIGQKRGRPSDVVMDKLYRLPQKSRAPERPGAIQSAGRAWLAAQGSRHGFALHPDSANIEAVRVIGYRVLRLERAGAPLRIGVLDFEGRLTVQDPKLFLDGVTRGFGRAKAFGCGLMLIRRC